MYHSHSNSVLPDLEISRKILAIFCWEIPNYWNTRISTAFSMKLYKRLPLHLSFSIWKIYSCWKSSKFYFIKFWNSFVSDCWGTISFATFGNSFGFKVAFSSWIYYFLNIFGRVSCFRYFCYIVLFKNSFSDTLLTFN